MNILALAIGFFTFLTYWMNRTAQEIEAATQPLSSLATLAARLRQSLSHSAA